MRRKALNEELHHLSWTKSGLIPDQMFQTRLLKMHAYTTDEPDNEGQHQQQ